LLSDTVTGRESSRSSRVCLEERDNVTTRFEDLRDDVIRKDDELDDSISIDLLEDFCDVTRSETLAASFASDASANETEDTGRDDTMQCVERDVNGAVTEPSTDASGTTMTLPSPSRFDF
jgi:hypothetical protein